MVEPRGVALVWEGVEGTATEGSHAHDLLNAIQSVIFPS